MLAPDANALGKPGSGVIIYVSRRGRVRWEDWTVSFLATPHGQHSTAGRTERAEEEHLVYFSLHFLPQLGKLNIENNTYTYDKKILIKGA